MTQITDGKAFRDKKLPKHVFFSRTYHNRISRQNETVEPSLRPLALALARPLTLRQPLRQAWTSVVDPQRAIPLCSLLCGHSPCQFVSPSFFCSSSYFEVRGNPYVRGENSSSMYAESMNANRRHRQTHIRCSSSSHRTKLAIYTAARSRGGNKDHSR